MVLVILRRFTLGLVAFKALHTESVRMHSATRSLTIADILIEPPLRKTRIVENSAWNCHRHTSHRDVLLQTRLHPRDPTTTTEKARLWVIDICSDAKQQCSGWFLKFGYMTTTSHCDKKIMTAISLSTTYSIDSFLFCYLRYDKVLQHLEAQHLNIKIPA